MIRSRHVVSGHGAAARNDAASLTVPAHGAYAETVKGIAAMPALLPFLRGGIVAYVAITTLAAAVLPLWILARVRLREIGQK